jgi:hypothetical protein
VFGNLLVVSYRESRKFPAQSQCMVGAPFSPCSGDLAWGAPTRIVADAVFEFVDSWPSDDSGRVVLSQIELDDKCNVVRTSPGARRYAVQAKPQTVRPLSLEGEKDIDRANPKVLYFHIDGGFPESVRLYLRGMPVSSLYYTELGRHTHVFKGSALALDIGHQHEFDGVPKTKQDGVHRHSYSVDDPSSGGAFMIKGSNQNQWSRKEETNDIANPLHISGGHRHEMEPMTLKNFARVLTPTVGGINEESGCIGGPAIRQGKPALSLFKDLIIKLDGKQVTELICDQLEALPLQAGKWKLQISPGDIRMNGSSLSQTDGTGEIDLLKLGFEIGIGQHKLEFIVSNPDVGGQLQYNLYVS